ncbi:MAG: hypothetical protein P4L82_15570 [Ancalomicrobiaceae bacterium]|nr:hypothetical protein [Ancalomicrobiaceae bacterium]
MRAVGIGPQGLVRKRERQMASFVGQELDFAVGEGSREIVARQANFAAADDAGRAASIGKSIEIE